MQIFNFRDGHVTTSRHPSGAYICLPGHRLSRVANDTPSESRLSIGTIVLGVKLFPVDCAQHAGAPSPPEQYTHAPLPSPFSLPPFPFSLPLPSLPLPLPFPSLPLEVGPLKSS